MRFFLFLLPVALAAQPAAPAPKPGAVEGNLVNSVTSAPIKDCTVILQSKTAEHSRFRYIALSDDRGHFVFPKVEPDSGYGAEAECAGFTMPPETRQSLRESPAISVGEGQSVRDVTVRLVSLGAISGKVVDPDGEPLRGVSVQALQYRFVAAGRRLDPVADATTDARGRYRLYFLKPGQYVVRAFLRGPSLRTAPPTPPTFPNSRWKRDTRRRAWNCA